MVLSLVASVALTSGRSTRPSPVLQSFKCNLSERVIRKSRNDSQCQRNSGQQNVGDDDRVFSNVFHDRLPALLFALLLTATLVALLGFRKTSVVSKFLEKILGNLLRSLLAPASVLVVRQDVDNSKGDLMNADLARATGHNTSASSPVAYYSGKDRSVERQNWERWQLTQAAWDALPDFEVVAIIKYDLQWMLVPESF